MTPVRRLLLALGTVALAQTGVLGAMVAERIWLLETGREITLPIVPVDPRDLFRGEYVRLGYGIGTVPAKLLVGPAPARNAPFYVTIENSPQVGWTPVKVTAAMPPQETAPDRIVLKARSRLQFPLSTRVHYGIESYFVPEGQGPRLEALARDKKMAALIAVDSRGNAAIKGLVIDGALQYEEPLF
jgi:uncharacterized membrane-anchored protein